MRFFGKKKQKTTSIGKIRKYDEEEVLFEEKTFSTFKIAPSPLWEGAKYAGGSRLSCFYSIKEEYNYCPYTKKNKLHHSILRHKNAKKQHSEFCKKVVFSSVEHSIYEIKFHSLFSILTQLPGFSMDSQLAW